MIKHALMFNFIITQILAVFKPISIDAHPTVSSYAQDNKYNKEKYYRGVSLYARYLCSRDALGLKAKQPVGQARRAAIGYLVYKVSVSVLSVSVFSFLSSGLNFWTKRTKWLYTKYPTVAHARAKVSCIQKTDTADKTDTNHERTLHMKSLFGITQQTHCPGKTSKD